MANNTPRTIRLLIVRHGETDHNIRGIIQGQLDTPLNATGHAQASYVAQYLSQEHIDHVYTSPLQRAKHTADAIVAVHPEYRGGVLKYWIDERLKEKYFGVREGKSWNWRKEHPDRKEGMEEDRVFQARLASLLADILSPSSPTQIIDTHSSHNQGWEDISFTREAQPDPIFASKTPSSKSFRTTSHFQTILLVSHGAAIHTLLSLLLAPGIATIDPAIKMSGIWNCSVSEMVVDLNGLPLTADGTVDLDKLAREPEKNYMRIVRWADVEHIPKEIDDEGVANADELIDK